MYSARVTSNESFILNKIAKSEIWKKNRRASIEKEWKYNILSYFAIYNTRRSLQQVHVEGFFKKRAATYSPTFAVPSA